MANFNKVILLGNLTRDPERRLTPSGTPVVSFGLAVNTPRAGSSSTGGGGQAALIEGRLQWRSWDGQDGQKRSKHEVMADRIHFMPRGREDGMERPGPGPARAGEESTLLPVEEDDIPF